MIRGLISLVVISGIIWVFVITLKVLGIDLLGSIRKIIAWIKGEDDYTV